MDKIVKKELLFHFTASLKQHIRHTSRNNDDYKERDFIYWFNLEMTCFNPNKAVATSPDDEEAN